MLAIQVLANERLKDPPVSGQGMPPFDRFEHLIRHLKDDRRTRRSHGAPRGRRPQRR